MNMAPTRYYVNELVEEIGSLPTVAAQIVGLATDPNCNLNQLAKIIRSDSVLTMRFLALANSAAMARGQEIRNLRDALVRLGLRRVRNVALCMGMHDLLPSDEDSGGLDRQAFWKFTLATASCAQSLARLRGAPADEDAYLVGILHTIGVAVLDQKAHRELARALDLADQLRCPLCTAELEIFDFHHGELGGRILTGWNLPTVFAEAIEFYPEDYDVEEISGEATQLVGLLREAIAVTRAIGMGSNGDGDTPPRLAELGGMLDMQGEELVALADEVDREVGAMSHLLQIDLQGGGYFGEAMQRSQRAVARIGLEGFDEAIARDRLEEELATAREIQQRLLPGRMPQWEGYDIAAVNRPCHQVSGDYYDFVAHADRSTSLVIADVSGKGMPASLLASNLQATLRALGTVHTGPVQIFTAANETLYESTDAELFATCFMANIDRERHQLRYASAGHNPPLLLHADGSCQWLPPAGTALGMFSEMEYKEAIVELASGDILVLYTDGVTEAIDGDGCEFTEQGLETVVRQHSGDSAASIVAAIEKAVITHATASRDDGDGEAAPAVPRGEAPTSDDLTVIVLRRE